jgi:putative endopeptidase
MRNRPELSVPRFSVAYMDPTVEARTDFARYAFGNWQKTHPIPADKAHWGSFNELDQFNQARLKAILEAAASQAHEPGSVEQKVGDFYASAMDTTTIDALGLKPLAADLKRIAAIISFEDLSQTLARLHDQGLSAFFGVSVDTDEKRSDMNALQAYQGGLSLPSRDHYFSEQFTKNRSDFIAHVARMFILCGDTPEAAASAASTVFATEKALATKSSTPVELRDSLANYNKMPTTQIAAIMPAFPFQAYLTARCINGNAAAEIIVGQPRFFTGLQEQLATRPMEDWKIYLRYRILRHAAPYLSSAFEQEAFRFYNTELQGTPAMEPRWQRAARVVNSEIGEALGRLYVTRYYPPAAKARMTEMVTHITAVMHDRLKVLAWMSEPTRQKALAKIDRFYAKIGHPEKWRDYATVTIERNNYFGNVRAATIAEVKRRIATLGQPVDKTEWGISASTVNAYFDPTANNINFPAGILQPPFFDFTLDDAVNYGGIGAIIAHEITHGFDDQGRHYDANGNLEEWWTESDDSEFKAHAQKLIDEFNYYEALPGVMVNGELTLGENIADLGGVSLAFEALQRSLVGKKRKRIDGLSPEQRFFISWAQIWRTNIRDSALRQQVTTDTHSPGRFRAIGPLVNFQPFYNAFDIATGDPMWRKPEDRAHIW